VVSEVSAHDLLAALFLGRTAWREFVVGQTHSVYGSQEEGGAFVTKPLPSNPLS
jgi:hypothetical protein